MQLPIILQSYTKQQLCDIGQQVRRHIPMTFKKRDMIRLLLMKPVKQHGGNDKKYASTDYWNQRYSNNQYDDFDWLFTYKELKPIIHQYINRKDKILVPGSGNARLSPDMYRDGFTDQDCIDISHEVTKKMGEKYKDMNGLDFIEMDILNNTLQHNHYDSILDKSIIDTFACHDDPNNKIQKMFSEYHKCLKPSGICMLISLHNKDWTLKHIDKNKWNILESQNHYKENGKIHSTHVLQKSLN